MTRTALVVLILVGLGAGYCWHRGALKSARASWETDRTADSLATAEAWQDSLQTLRDSARAVYDDSVATWTAELTDLRRMRQTLARRNDSLLTTLSPVVDALPDSTRAVVTAAVRGLASELDACTAEAKKLDGLWTGCQMQLRAADSTITELRDLSRARQELVTRLQRQSQPGLFERIRRGLPWLGVGVLAGFVLTR